MKTRGLALCLALSASTLVLGLASARDLGKDLPDASDIPGIPRFADSVIIGYRASKFDETTIPTGPWDRRADGGAWKETTKVEGRRTRILYIAPHDASALEVIRNYQQALEGQGYEALYQCSGFDACGEKVEQFYIDEAHGKKLTDTHLLKYVFSDTSVQEPQIYSARHKSADGDSYVFVFAAYQDNFADSAAGDRVAVFVEEVLAKPMQDRMVLVDAKKLAQDISQAGRVALYGIHFDFDKASIRPESRPQLDEMARMLNEQPELEVYVVGHTDNKGTLDYNIDLSQRRAEAVVQALIQNYGIVGARLTPKGVANLSPLGTNATEEGRALNRRVELVAQ
ncbi:OmpA family protein [Thiocystis violacea]|uniref:OmpA family protein n=1 Tax=Thiocystis violacea TaxID=13725 RepID=UPI001905638D|nr:OmpA family protein [Thiocystis violacea]MBK1721864.1 flagellar motor protein MotB [Thiocystis violacea]